MPRLTIERALISRARQPWPGPPVVFGGILAIGAVLAALTASPDMVEQARLAARWTARVSACLFLLVYTAPSLARIWPDSLFDEFRRDGRYWGLGFALAHFIHLAALTGFFAISGEPPAMVTLVGGGFGYALIAAMAATSTDAARRRMGAGWVWLHRIGLHYVWLIFMTSYARRILRPDQLWTGIIFTGLFLAALALRIVMARIGRRGVAA